MLVQRAWEAEEARNGGKAGGGGGGGGGGPEAPSEQEEWVKKVRANPWRLRAAPAPWRANRAVVLAAVEKEPMTLQYAAAELQEDEEARPAGLPASRAKASQPAGSELTSPIRLEIRLIPMRF